MKPPAAQHLLSESDRGEASGLPIPSGGDLPAARYGNSDYGTRARPRNPWPTTTLSGLDRERRHRQTTGSPSGSNTVRCEPAVRTPDGPGRIVRALTDTTPPPAVTNPSLLKSRCRSTISLRSFSSIWKNRSGSTRGDAGNRPCSHTPSSRTADMKSAAPQHRLQLQPPEQCRSVRRASRSACFLVTGPQTP